MSEKKNPKKVVKAVTPAKAADSGAGAGKKERVWTATPEAQALAKRLRIFAWAGWIVALGLEVFTIVKILPTASETFWLLLVMLLPIAALAIGANLMWKKANRLNPASRASPTKFFIQNQLGAIMTILAFLPLIIFILLDKNLDGKQKGIAGGIAAVAMLAIAAFTGLEWDGGPSQEQYAYEENVIERLTGEDLVYWVKGGSVFHVCSEVPDVNRESVDGTIYKGTVAQAHAFGKDRLTKRWESEAMNHCGYSQADVDAVNAGLAVDFPDGVNPVDDSDTGESNTEETDPADSDTEDAGE